MKPIKLKCFCGKVKGSIDIESLKNSFHIHCLCSDCQMFAKHLGTDDKVLDKFGSSDLFQTYPRYINITEGEGEIACLKLSEKGLLRWYTRCCNAPIANTMDNPKLAFAGVSTQFMEFKDEDEKLNILGPVLYKSFAKDAIDEKPLDSHDSFPVSFLPKMLKFFIIGFFRGMHKSTPFFKSGKMTVKPIILTK